MNKINHHGTYRDVEKPDIVYRYPIVTAPFMEVAPKIDGTVDKDEWAYASQSLPLIERMSGKKTQETAVFWIGYTEEMLHLAFRFDRPPDGQKPKAQNNPNDVWYDDCIRLRLVPELDAPRDFSFVVNTLGIGDEGLCTQGNIDKSWNARWFCAARIIDNAWEGEISIPFSSLGRQTPKPGEVWKILVVRIQNTPEIEVGVSSFLKSGNAIEDFGYLKFGRKETVSVRVLTAGVLNAGETGSLIELVGVNKPCSVNVQASLYRPAGPTFHATVEDSIGEVWKVKQVELNFFQAVENMAIEKVFSRYELLKKWDETVRVPAEENVCLRLGLKTEAGKYLIHYRVTDADTRELLSGGSLSFEQRPVLDVKVDSYLLMAKTLVVRADYRQISNLTEGIKIVVELLNELGKTTLGKEESPIDLRIRSNTFVFPIEARFGATYIVRTRMVSDGGETIAEYSQRITLPDRPQWVGNTIGITEDPLPGWIPIELDRNIAKVVLRDYKIGESGLPSMITSRGKRLLAGPVILSLEGQALSWSRVLEHQSAGKVVWRSSSKFGQFTMNMQTTLEYDGLLRYDLSLDPGQNPIDVKDLVLFIPYRKEMARFGREAVIKEFQPSYQIGDFETGLYWFCEWAKGWQIGELPVIEVKPVGETVEWMIRFIGREGKSIREPLNLTFGLQALPVRELDLSHQYKRRGFMWGDDELIDNPDITECSLLYPAKDNMPVEAGALVFQALFNENARLVQLGSGENSISVYYEKTYYRKDPLPLELPAALVLYLGDKTIEKEGKFIASIKPMVRKGTWQPIGLSWKRETDTLNFELVTTIPNGEVLVAYGSIPFSAWKKILSSDILRFGGQRTIGIDNVLISKKFYSSVELVRLFDNKPQCRDEFTLIDPIDDLRFYQGLYMTRPLVIQNGRGGIAGAKYTAGFVKKIDGEFGKAVYLPAGEKNHWSDLFKALGGDSALPLFEQWHQITGYYELSFFADPIFRNEIKKIQDQGFNVIFYGNFVLNPEHDMNVSAFMKELAFEPEQKALTGVTPCVRTPAQDYYIYEWKKNIDYYGVKSIQADNTINCRYECKNVFHGCGWYDENGQLHGRWSIFGAREMAKRFRWLFHVYIKDGFVALHAGARLFAPVVAFTDLYHFGEMLKPEEFEKLKLPEDWENGYQFRYGVAGEWLTGKGNWGENYLFLYTLLYNMSVRFCCWFMNPWWWRPDSADPLSGKIADFNPYFVKLGVKGVATPIVLWWQLQDEFDTRTAEFKPFWSNQEYVMLNHERLRTSFYCHHGKDALFVVSNFSNEPVDVHVTINFEKIGLHEKNLRVYDAYTDKDYILERNIVKLRIPGQEYRLIRIEEP